MSTAPAPVDSTVIDFACWLGASDASIVWSGDGQFDIFIRGGAETFDRDAKLHNSGRQQAEHIVAIVACGDGARESGFLVC